MKKLFTILSVACAMAVGCEQYDHTPIWDKLNDHENRIVTLEDLCNRFNTNIGSLQDIVAALQQNDYVTNVVAIVEGGKEIGYTITFSKTGTVTIYHGKDGANGQDGKPGADGQDGKPGTDGVNGTDGHTPIVGLKKAEDGIYYWTIDGQWLTDDEGNMIPATGKDGADGQSGQNGTDGQPGADGKDGVTPQLKIEEGYWYVSYDNGVSWTQLGKATGEDGTNGAPGQDGNQGADGDSMFEDVQVSADYVIITLAGGTQFKIPTWKAFEYLQAQIDQININVASLQTMVQALQNNDYVTGVVPFYENGKVAGYSITFSQSGVVTIYHGKDGKDGVDGAPGQDGAAGAPGQNGTDGKDGVDGATPVIGVKKDTDGKYYWTLNGSWLLDDAGNKIPTTGADGKDGVDGTPGQDGAAGTPGQNGSNGTNGTDGVTPKLKIEDGYWFVSYDNGATWTKLDKATGEDGKDGEDGEDGAPGQDGAPGAPGQNGTDGKDGVDGDSFFQSVDTANADFVLITLADGTQIKLPTWKAFSDLQALVNKLNTNVASLQTLVAALENNDYVKNVTSVMEGGKVVGYTITFSKSAPVTIYHGKDGKDGVDGAPGQDGAAGAPGQNGTDGKDGVDGATPVIGVKKDTDGKYYWTLNGSWLLDDAGNKIPTTGADGKDGVDGTPGQDGAAGTPGQNGSNGTNGTDGVTPKLKIEDGYWFVSYDNGATWTKLDKATGEDGAPGQDGAPGAPGQNGTDGKDGVDGDSFFQSVDTANADYVLFTLADGTQIKLPTWKAYEDLKALVSQVNANVASLQTIVTALEGKDYVLEITPIYENSKEIGYVITFSKSGKVTIYHGKDGKDGVDGAPGQDGAAGAPGQNGNDGIDGEDGIDGVDGKTPVIGVKKDTDGKYYWTVNGEWLRDDAGNKIPTTGADGKDGVDGTPGTNGNDGAAGQPGAAGTPGKDGVTPQLKIENGYWKISYDNGVTWETLGKATGEDGTPGQNGDSMFQKVESDDTTVTFTLADGTKLYVPLITNGVVVDLVSKDEFSAYFEGTVAKRAVDFKVTVYYSTSSNISLYNYFNSVTVTSATNGSFALQLDNLYSQTKYYYFVETVNNGKTSYTGVMTFITAAVTGYDSQFDIASATNLATSESANSYIVTAPGTYKIPAVKGNGTDSVGSVSTVDVLWESLGTATTPVRGTLVKGAQYNGGYVYFKTNDTFTEGNAVIAAKDSDGTVLWSWHIWMTDQPKGQTYFKNAGTMMDRNLGATNTTPGTVEALGLMYQWGRKDPFMGSSSINSVVEAKSTISFPTPVVTSATVGTVEWATENPTTLIMGGNSNKWMYVQDKTLWATTKTVYDPCPAGWKIPEAGENGVWCKAAGGIRINADLFDDVNRGVNLSGHVGSDETIWYPATGYYGKTNGVFYGVGQNASYHSCTLDSYGHLCFVINSNDTYLYLLNLTDFGGAAPVRCIKE